MLRLHPEAEHQPKVVQIARLATHHHGSDLLRHQLLGSQGSHHKGTHVVVLGGHQFPLGIDLLRLSIHADSHCALAAISSIEKRPAEADIEAIPCLGLPLAANLSQDAEIGQPSHRLLPELPQLRERKEGFRAIEVQVLGVAVAAIDCAEGRAALEDQRLSAPVDEPQEQMLDVVPLLGLHSDAVPAGDALNLGSGQHQPAPPLAAISRSGRLTTTCQRVTVRPSRGREGSSLIGLSEPASPSAV